MHKAIQRFVAKIWLGIWNRDDLLPERGWDKYGGGAVHRGMVVEYSGFMDFSMFIY